MSAGRLSGQTAGGNPPGRLLPERRRIPAGARRAAAEGRGAPAGGQRPAAGQHPRSGGANPSGPPGCPAGPGLEQLQRPTQCGPARRGPRPRRPGRFRGAAGGTSVRGRPVRPVRRDWPGDRGPDPVPGRCLHGVQLLPGIRDAGARAGGERQHPLLSKRFRRGRMVPQRGEGRALLALHPLPLQPGLPGIQPSGQCGRL